MSEEKIVSSKDLEPTILFEGKPFTGTSVDHFESGQKEIEGHFKDGKQDALFTTWYENGQKKMEAYFKDGELNGLSTGWYENGQKLGEGDNKDGERC